MEVGEPGKVRYTSPTRSKEILVFTCNPGDVREVRFLCNHLVAKNAHKQRTYRLFR